MEEEEMEEKEAIKMLEDIVSENPVNLSKIQPFMYEILYLLQKKDREIKELKEKIKKETEENIKYIIKIDTEEIIERIKKEYKLKGE